MKIDGFIFDVRSEVADKARHKPKKVNDIGCVRGLISTSGYPF